MNATYATRSDAIAAVITAIEATGEASADEYDIDAIAAEVIGDYAHGYQIDEDAFWTVVASHVK